MAAAVSRSEIPLISNWGETHEFVVRQFGRQPFDIGLKLESPVFELCGHKWNIGVYLGGTNRDNVGWIGIYIYNKGDAITAENKFDLLAESQSAPLWTGAVSKDVFLAVGTQTAELRAQNKFESWGMQRTMRRDDAIARAGAEGSLIVRMKIRCVHVDRQQQSSLEALPVPAPTLGKDLGALLETGYSSDVVLRVSGCDFKAHKLILSARSRVLRAMFDGRFKEGTSTSSAAAVVELGDVDAETLERLLLFIYTGSAAADSEIEFDGWARLLGAADRFDVGELFALSQRRIAERLTSQNAVECLSIASRYPAANGLHSAALDLLVHEGVPEDADLPPEVARALLSHLKVIKPRASK